MGFTLLGILGAGAAGGGEFPYWFATYEDVGFTINHCAHALSSDSTKLHLFGRTSRNSGDMFYFQTTTGGTFQNGKYYNRSGNENSSQIVQGPSGNIYASGYEGDNGFLLRLDSTGTSQFEKRYRYNDYYGGYINYIYPAGNDVIVGTTTIGGEGTGQGYAYIHKVTPTGTIPYSNAAGYDVGVGFNTVHYDGTNVWGLTGGGYFTGRCWWRFDANLGSKAFITQNPGSYTSVGAVTSSYLYTSSFNYVGSNRTTTVYRTTKTVVGYDQPKSYNYFSYDYGTSVNPIRKITHDAAGNTYVLDSNGTIFKLDTSFAVVYQRRIKYNGSYIVWNEMSVDSNGNLYLSGSIANKACIIKIKADGSQTGTYTVAGISVVIEAGTRTITSGTTNVLQYGSESGGGDYRWYDDTFTDTTLALTSAIGQVN